MSQLAEIDVTKYLTFGRSVGDKTNFVCPAMGRPTNELAYYVLIVFLKSTLRGLSWQTKALKILRRLTPFKSSFDFPQKNVLALQTHRNMGDACL